MAEIGSVIEQKGSKVVVRLERKEACAKCRACVAGLKSEEMFIEAENICQAEVGDTVNITLEKSNFLKAVIIMYTIPLILFLTTTLVSLYIFENELLSLLLGIASLAITYIIIRKNDKHFNNSKYIPIANKIINN